MNKKLERLFAKKAAFADVAPELGAAIGFPEGSIEAETYIMEHPEILTVLPMKVASVSYEASDIEMDSKKGAGGAYQAAFKLVGAETYFGTARDDIYLHLSEGQCEKLFAYLDQADGANPIVQSNILDLQIALESIREVNRHHRKLAEVIYDVAQLDTYASLPAAE